MSLRAGLKFLLLSDTPAQNFRATGASETLADHFLEGQCVLGVSLFDFISDISFLTALRTW